MQWCSARTVVQFGAVVQVQWCTCTVRPLQVIADSNVIIARLTTLFAASVVIPVHTPEQRAIAHAATRMVEEHLAQTGFYYRYGAHACLMP